MTINKEGRVLAVDGDIIAYRTAAVCEEQFEGACKSIIASTLKEIATETGISNMRIYLSGKDNYRYKVAKTQAYKGNRATMVRPQFLEFCLNHLIIEYGAIRVHGYEADDGIASDMTLNNAIHCGHDKDLMQIAGDHYYYVNKEWRHVTEEEAEITLYRQVLMGDTSDNVPGLPRVGEKKAADAIQDYASARDDAIDMYKLVCEEKLDMDADQAMEYFREQHSLIAMCTNVNFLDIITTYVAPETHGFEADEEVAEDAPIKEKARPRL